MACSSDEAWHAETFFVCHDRADERHSLDNFRSFYSLDVCHCVRVTCTSPQEFEDLDEIIARFVQPMAANARDLISHKNYREVGGKKELVEDMLKQAKKATPSRIPYFMTASRSLPGIAQQFPGLLVRVNRVASIFLKNYDSR